MKKRYSTSVMILLLAAVPAVVAAWFLASPAYAGEPSGGATHTATAIGPDIQLTTQARWPTGHAILKPVDLPLTASTADLLYQRVSRIYPRADSFDVTLSYTLTDMFLLTGAGRFFLTHEQPRFTSRAARFGVDFESPWTFFGRSFQPISSAEVHFREENKWSTDFSIRTGLHWNMGAMSGHSAALLLECFHGELHSSNRMYRQKISYFGLAFHYGF